MTSNFFLDLIHKAPDPMIKDLITSLFPADGSSGMSGIALTLNTALAIMAVSLLLFQIAVHVIGHGISKVEAKEGQDSSLINDKTVFGLVRSIAAVGLVIPSPATGLAIYNKLIIILMLFGSNLAQKAWDSAFDAMYKQPLVGNTAAFTETRTVALQLFAGDVCYFYLRLELGKDVSGNASFPTVKNGNLELDGRPAFFGAKPHCGTFTMQDASRVVPALSFTSGSPLHSPDFTPVNLETIYYKAPTAAYQKQAEALFAKFQTQISPLARRYALSQWPQTADKTQAPTVDDIDKLIKNYTDKLSEAHKTLRTTIMKEVNNNRYRKEAGKWYMSAGYMRRLSEANFIADRLRAFAMPVVKATEWQRIWPNPPEHVIALTNHLYEFINSNQPAFSQVVGNKEWSKNRSFDMSEAMSMVLGYLKDSIIPYKIDNTANKHPLEILMDDGNFMLAAGAGIAAVQTALAAIPIEGQIQTGVGSWLTPIMWLLLAAGFILASVVPLIPWIMMSAALFAWAILACSLFVTAGFMILFHVRVGSPKFLFGSGWVGFVEIAFRPIIALFALWVSFHLFIAASGFLSATFSNALNNLQFSSITVIATYGFYSLMFSLLQVLVAFGSFMLITAIPGELSKRVPTEGDVIGGKS